MKVGVTELPAYEVAFIRRVGSYFEPQEHWGRLMLWSSKNGLTPPSQKFIGISLDDPQVVEGKECRHDACVTIPEGFNKENHKEIQFKRLDSGCYGLYPFYDKVENLNNVYRYIFEQWLPSNKYEVDERRNYLEFNLNNPAEDPEGKCRVDLYVPLKSREA
ncbi:GyrI-like domain-containing protein [Rossellomorea marisflavi]|uniref:AraC family transcriptional regulator n=1 Tax=Rossellomorea marisflavi TaxID=189381 RepID=UPI0027AB8F40|nr:GyrI-like domain-containing protein [Rossellomorea marisflavi]UTE73847.1 GyrI-like domain-containing protein [Rossellomorea marisflavi]